MIKSYTDLKQSKKLAEILPLESADMWWAWYSSPLSNGHYGDFPMFSKPVCNPDESIPCWSLTALLKLIPKHILRKDKIHCGQAFIPSFRWEITPTAIYYTDGGGVMDYVSFRYGDNNIELIDAVFKMVIKLHEQKLL